MKKIILIFVFLFLISLVNAQIQTVPLNSVINSSDITQINDNLNLIKSNYGVDIEFVIDNSNDPVMKNSLYEFSDFVFSKGVSINNGVVSSHKVSDWDSVVYYNIKQNQLRFVTHKDCDFIYNYLNQIKQKDFIQNVLNSPSPTNDDISNMFLQISIEFKNTAQSLDENTCSNLSNQLSLRSNEYGIPALVLGEMYAIQTNTDVSHPPSVILGYYVDSTMSLPSNPFDFLSFVNSPKKKFYTFLQNNGFSQDKIDYYYNTISTKGNILFNSQNPEADSSLIFHERTHKIMTEVLTDSERQTLENARNGFLSYLKTIDVNYNLIGQTESSPIYNGSWQELYAHMAQLEKYPYEQSYDRYIDERVYKLFAEKYPSAYTMYQEVYNLASQ
ncbi:MAG: hypothetical protein M1165_01465 [Candidatus Pacearchaeota archaeon]|nr:hypothetical protein [Candidatus Pacearchaeota archaeon]